MASHSGILMNRRGIAVFAFLSALLVLYLDLVPNMTTWIGPQCATTPETVVAEGRLWKQPDSEHSSLDFAARKQPDSNQNSLVSAGRPPVQQKRPPIPREGPEIRQVVFAKVHKAASSTMQNIFLRFAAARNLSVVLPSSRTSLSEDSNHIGGVVPHSEGKQYYDILCNHILFDAKDISKYIPETAVRIAILRDPLGHTLSALKFYYTVWDRFQALKNGYSKHKDDPINGFLLHPEDFYDKNQGPAASYINNRMSVDLGFDLEDDMEASKKNQTRIREFIQRVEHQFDLVLLSDFFDESLILMRRVLRWSMKDIVYLKVNVAANQRNPVWDTKPELTPEALQRFREWDSIDVQLYDHFATIFSKTIHNEPLLREELQAFHAVQTQVKDFCLGADQTAKILEIPKRAWTESFTISRYDCQLMTTSEKDFTDEMRTTQKKRYEDYRRSSNVNSTQQS